jgi:predicted ATPase
MYLTVSAKGTKDEQMFTFVGRTTELQQLNNLLQKARQKHGRVVLLSGEAGIGKSALVEYFLAKYATDVQVFQSKCNEQYGEGSAFLPWIEILTDIISDKDSEGKPIASKLLAVVKDTLGPWMGVVPVVGSLIAAVWETGKSVKTQFGEKGEPAKDRYTRDDFYQSFVTTLQKVGELRPIVLFIDDLHWGDASSIGLLRWLTEKIATLPVLIIGVYRPSDINVGREGLPHPLKDAIYEMHARYRLWTVLDLDVLSWDVVSEYLTIAFPKNLFTTTFVAFLYDVTDGIPFFLEQYIQLLKEQGHLIQIHGKWQLTCDLSVIQDEVPKDVQGVIQKRLNRLQDEIMKNVLLYGSAEGEEFTSLCTIQIDELGRFANDRTSQSSNTD